MKYNFDEIINRNGTYSYKWDAIAKNFDGRTDLLPMWVADMDFKCPNEVITAIQKRAEHGIYAYSTSDRSVGEIFAPWLKKRHGWDINKENTIFCGGIVPALSIAVRAFSNPSEKVIIQTPVYYPFSEAIINNGRIPARNSLKFDGEHWCIDFEQLEELARDENTGLMLLCNPHNPVSRVYTEDELKRVGEICKRNNVIIFSDEIHSDLVFKPYRHVPIASISKDLAEITVTAVSPSKTFNIAGLQASALICDNNEVFAKISTEVNRNVHIMSLFAAAALEAVYENGEEYLEQLIEYLWGNYLYLDNFLKENCPKILCQKPEATYLLWLDCRQLGLDNNELRLFFLDEAKLALDFGPQFGTEGSGYVRMNVGCPKKILEKAMEMLKGAYEKRNF